MTPISDYFAVLVGTALMVCLFFAGLVYSAPYVAFFALWSLGSACVAHWMEGFYSSDIEEKWASWTSPAFFVAYWASLLMGVSAVVAAGFMIF